MTAVERRSALGVALVALSSLALEVALVRVLSVSLWYHFAFMVVSTAVLGYGLSGMALALWPRLAEERRLPLAYPVSLLAGYFAQNAMPFDPFGVARAPLSALWAGPFFAALSAPFFVSGLLIAGVLAREVARAPRIYAADLAGAGLGALVLAPAFGIFGGTGTIVIIGAVACLGAALLSESASHRATLALAAVALALGARAIDAAVPVRITENKVAAEGVPMAAILRDRASTVWNAESRVDVVRSERGTFLAIDGGVALVRVPRVPHARLEPPLDATTLAFAALDAPSVLVIGSGAGYEVLGALGHGATKVVAVEVNAAITGLLGRELRPNVGRLYADPRVTAVTDEGRSYLDRSADRFDVIVSAHTISNAASTSGALSLSESYTLTAEAFDAYLEHLEDRGLLLLTRPESQLPRLFTTARDALERRGATPREHLLAFREPLAPGERASFSAAFLLSRRPIDPATRARIDAHAARLGLEPLYAPGLAEREPFPRLLTASWEELSSGPRELAPATDDRPFFLQTLRWSALDLAALSAFFGAGSRGRLALEDAPVGELAVLLLLASTTILAAIFTVAPLLVARRRGHRAPRWAIGYFAALGLGFAFAELGLVHKLGLFVGPPTATFAAVIGGLLVWSGLGARLVAGRSLSWRTPALAIAAIALSGALIGPVTALGLGLPLGLRVAAAIALCAPVGIALGAPFPLGLCALAGEGRPALAIAWGLNGFASVLGSVLTVVIAMRLGFTAVLVAAALCYATAAIAARAVGGPAPQSD